MNEVIRLSNGI